MDRVNTLTIAAFVAITMVIYWDSPGDDISSTYIACLLIANDMSNAIYSHHPVYFHIVEDQRWVKAAENSNFNGFLHPFVQLPSWPAVLKPLCTNLSFPWFNRLFSLLSITSLVGTIIIISKYWAPVFVRPKFLAILLPSIWVSAPFSYTFFLTQNHPQIVFLCVASIALAKRNPLFAGGLLAFAGAIKITPLFVVLYWLSKRDFAPAAWTAIWITLVMTASFAITSIDLMKAYISEVLRIGDVLLVSYNNQSLAAWIGGFFHPEHISNWIMLPTPSGIKVISASLLLITCIAGGLMDRSSTRGFGAAFTLVGLTLFTPIAWSHYYLVLIFPAMLIAQHAEKCRAAPLFLISLFLLSIPPLSLIQQEPVMTPVTLVRASFYSGLLAMLALLIIWRNTTESEPIRQQLESFTPPPHTAPTPALAPSPVHPPQTPYSPPAR